MASGRGRTGGGVEEAAEEEAREALAKVVRADCVSVGPSVMCKQPPTPNCELLLVRLWLPCRQNYQSTLLGKSSKQLRGGRHPAENPSESQGI